ncbi:NosD domain-containing protein [Halorussus amylolyticus]|uniref:NosD domain-containing protein n=1 Tax=Halorussus amylolyticus TaxID=1126242 RepID=UPI0010478FE4|nr:right-handed parallel beta-helix repeat-containing protein [Halorussus amylolyticus]
MIPRDTLTRDGGRTVAAGLLTLALVAAVGAVATASSATAPTSTDSVQVGQSATALDSCRTITESGTYVLTADIENAGNTAISEACIEIRADDVTFDGDGYAIGGRGESHTRAVSVVGATNVTVRNVHVHDWHEGVVVENGSASVVEVTSSANAYGIRFQNATDSSASGNTVEDNLVGIQATGEGSISVSDNDLSGNEISVRGVENESV